MLEGEHSYQRGQENLVPSNNTSPAPENPAIPKAQAKPWYIRHFTKLLIGFGLGGGAVAILLPWMLWLLCGMSSGSSDQLRLHLLYVTGGIIAVLTLLQTNWKNQGDRLKIDADIKKNEQDAKNETAKREQDTVKSERDHTRQVHAERRNRYAKAVEQLADEKATVRLGGIYTLVGLVDEWLADDTLEQEERQKEGQVIINNLCSYIRSPFPLALKAEILEDDSGPGNYEGDFSKDQAAFHEEQDVRRSIFDEMSKRSSSVILSDEGDVIETVPGKWREFDIDFSRAPIFYPLNAITIEKGNFSSAKFYSNADFNEATFIETADFSAVIFPKAAKFNEATFAQAAKFNEATFAQAAEFSEATFAQTTGFNAAAFAQRADFSGTKFTSFANFSGVKFTNTANFFAATFTDAATFVAAAFTNTANFFGTKFTQWVNFRQATFSKSVIFIDTTFKNYEPFFVSGNFRARFSVHSAQDDYRFEVSESHRPIETEQITVADGRVFTIPVGCELFDPAPLPAPKPKEKSTE